MVTANKELLANDGKELFDAADAAGLDLAFEAAVAGGIPLIRPLKESLAGERVGRMLGIVNGTTNYILTQMSEHGWSFDDALAEAQRLGYAEADPTADVEGYDAAAKCAILASIAFNTRVVAGDVFREGIARVTAQDIADADAPRLRRQAARDRRAGGRRRSRSASTPRWSPRRIRSRRVRDAFNAVFVEGREGRPADVLRARGRRRSDGDGGRRATSSRSRATSRTAAARSDARVRSSGRIRPMGDTRGQYYLNLHVEDRPGVLAEIAERFGHNGVSIERVWQEGSGDEATLVFITHRAQEGAFQKTSQELRELDAVRAVASMLRVEGEEMSA